MTSQDRITVMKGRRPAPFEPPKSTPFRQITKIGSYEDGDTNGGYMGYITLEQYSKENSRFHRIERVGSGVRSEEILKIGKGVFSRLENGKWVAEDIPSRTQAVRVQENPVNYPYIRKPGAE